MRCYAHVIPIKSMRSSDCVSNARHDSVPDERLDEFYRYCTALQATTNVEAMADNLGVEQAEASAIVPEAVTKQGKPMHNPNRRFGWPRWTSCERLPHHPDRAEPKDRVLKDWHKNALETPEAVDAFYEHNPTLIAFCPEDMGIVLID